MTALVFSKRIANRLDKLENHLAYVVSLHLLVEYLIDQVIAHESPLSRAQFRERVLEDRHFTFSVKLMMAFHMNAIPRALYANIHALNGLRNTYAHRIDVDLAHALFRKGSRPFVLRSGQPAFKNGAAQAAVAADPSVAGLQALHHVRSLTLGWLFDICQDRGIET